MSRHTGVLQEFLQHAIPDCLVRGTDLFSLILSNKKKMTTGNTTIAVWCEWIKITFFCQISKNIFFCRILVISLYVPWDEKGWKSLLYFISASHWSSAWCPCFGAEYHVGDHRFDSLHEFTELPTLCTYFFLIEILDHMTLLRFFMLPVFSQFLFFLLLNQQVLFKTVQMHSYHSKANRTCTGLPCTLAW